jgi:hypothetical protein
MWKNIKIFYSMRTQALSFPLVGNLTAYYAENKVKFRTSRNDNNYAFHRKT